MEPGITITNHHHHHQQQHEFKATSTANPYDRRQPPVARNVSNNHLDALAQFLRLPLGLHSISNRTQPIDFREHAFHILVSILTFPRKLDRPMYIPHPFTHVPPRARFPYMSQTLKSWFPCRTPKTHTTIILNSESTTSISPTSRPKTDSRCTVYHTHPRKSRKTRPQLTTVAFAIKSKLGLLGGGGGRGLCVRIEATEPPSPYCLTANGLCRRSTYHSLVGDPLPRVVEQDAVAFGRQGGAPVRVPHEVAKVGALQGRRVLLEGRPCRCLVNGCFGGQSTRGRRKLIVSLCG